MLKHTKKTISSQTFLGVSRPVSIACEFMQWTGKNTRPFLRFIRSCLQVSTIRRYPNIGGRPEIEVRTGHRVFEIRPGDWIMKSPSGDLNDLYFEKKNPIK